MAGQVCREIRDNSGKIVGFEVVGHIVNGVDILADKEAPKVIKKKGK